MKSSKYKYFNVLLVACVCLSILVIGSMKSEPTVNAASNEDIAWKYFTSRGYTPAATAGIIGNFYHESGLEPKRAQYGGGPGRGIAQWGYNADGGRFNSLIQWARSVGKSEWALDTQLEWTVKEMTSYGLNPTMKSITDVAAATKYFGAKFEKPRDLNASIASRISNAQGVYSRHSGAGGTVNVWPNPNNLSFTGKVWMTPSVAGDTGYILNGPNTNAKVWEWDSNGNKVPSLPKYKKILVQYVIPGVYGSMIGNVSYGKVEAILDATGKVVNLPAEKSYFVVINKNGNNVMKSEGVPPNPNNLQEISRVWVTPTVQGDTGYILNGPNTNAKIWEWDLNGNKVASLPKYKKVLVHSVIQGMYGSLVGNVTYAKVAAVLDATGNVINIPSGKNYYVIMSKNGIGTVRLESVPPNPGNLKSVSAVWLTPKVATAKNNVLNGPNTNAPILEWDANGNKLPTLAKYKKVYISQEIDGLYGSAIGEVRYAKVSKYIDASNKVIDVSGKNYFVTRSVEDAKVFNETVNP